jgi:ketosteroid isomerase-like protein
VTLDPQVATDRFHHRVDAWLAEDADAYLACWADDMEITLPGRHAPLRGRDAYRKLVLQSFAWARPVAFSVHHLAVTGEALLAEWTIRAERRADRVVVEWHGMSACALGDDGLILWWREYHRGQPVPVP